jgi:hypothetical protein
VQSSPVVLQPVHRDAAGAQPGCTGGITICTARVTDWSEHSMPVWAKFVGIAALSGTPKSRDRSGYARPDAALKQKSVRLKRTSRLVSSAKTKIVVRQRLSPGDTHDVSRPAQTSSPHGNRRAVSVYDRWLEHDPGWVPEFQDLARSVAGPGCNAVIAFEEAAAVARAKWNTSRLSTRVRRHILWKIKRWWMANAGSVAYS